MTFHWRSKEYVCLKCGALYAFLDPIRKNATPARLARQKEREDEFEEHARYFITPGSRLIGCEGCKREDHQHHATEGEWERHREAYAWLLERTGRKKVAA